MKSRHVRWFPFQVLNITEHPLGPFQRQVTSLLREECYSSPIAPTTRWLVLLVFYLNLPLTLLAWSRHARSLVSLLTQNIAPAFYIPPFHDVNPQRDIPLSWCQPTEGYSPFMMSAHRGIFPLHDVSPQRDILLSMTSAHRGISPFHDVSPQRDISPQRGHGWAKLERIEMDCIWVNLKNFGPPFFSNLYQFISKCHLHSWKIIFSCYAANGRLWLCQFDV